MNGNFLEIGNGSDDSFSEFEQTLCKLRQVFNTDSFLNEPINLQTDHTVKSMQNQNK